MIITYQVTVLIMEIKAVVSLHKEHIRKSKLLIEMQRYARQ